MYGSNRKKVQCACYPCVKAKRGCDLERPCSRCVKKGIPEQCLEKKDYELFFNSPIISKINSQKEPIYEEEDQQMKNTDLLILEDPEGDNIRTSIQDILELKDPSPYNPEDSTADVNHDNDNLHFRNNSLEWERTYHSFNHSSWRE